MCTFEISGVALVDVGCCALLLCPHGDQMIRRARLHIEEEHGIRHRQPHLAELEIVEPVEICVPLRCVSDLHCLMHHIRGRIAVSEDNSTILVVLPPLHPIGGIAVHGKKSRGSIGIHIIRMRTEISAQIHAHKHGRIRLIVGKGNGHNAAPLPHKPLCEHACLRFLARAVPRLNDKKLSFCHRHPSAITVTVRRDISAAPTTCAPTARMARR